MLKNIYKFRHAHLIKTKKKDKEFKFLLKLAVGAIMKSMGMVTLCKHKKWRLWTVWFFLRPFQLDS